MQVSAKSAQNGVAHTNGHADTNGHASHSGSNSLTEAAAGIIPWFYNKSQIGNKQA